MSAKWIDSSQEEFTASIEMTGIDDLGLVNDITAVISSNMHVNMKSVSFDTDGGTFTGRVRVVVKNKNEVNKLINKLKKINGIEKVTRL